MIAPIQSLAQLKSKAQKDYKYRDLAVLTAEDLGGPSSAEPDFSKSYQYLNTLANEEGEESVVDELNFRRDKVV